jgi:putative transposase
VVEKEPYLWAVTRYIEQNPVRASLIKKAEDYEWSSAKAHVLGIKDSILSDESWFNEKEIKTYREFIRKDAEEINAVIRRATSTGRPLGSEGFIKKLERILKRDLFPKKGGRPKRKGRNNMGSVPIIYYLFIIIYLLLFIYYSTHLFSSSLVFVYAKSYPKFFRAS